MRLSYFLNGARNCDALKEKPGRVQRLKFKVQSLKFKVGGKEPGGVQGQKPGVRIQDSEGRVRKDFSEAPLSGSPPRGTSGEREADARIARLGGMGWERGGEGRRFWEG